MTCNRLLQNKTIIPFSHEIGDARQLQILQANWQSSWPNLRDNLRRMLRRTRSMSCSSKGFGA
jgi:hypothetical protein